MKKPARFLAFLDECVAVSRPSQWVYTFLPFMLGALSGMTKFSSLWRPDFLVLCLFFLWPANFLIHGLQAWFEPEQARRHRDVMAEKSTPVRPPLLGQGLIVMGVLFSWLILELAAGPAFALVLWFVLVCLSFLPPFRLQRRPFFDIYGSTFSILPAVVGFWWATLQPPDLSTIVALGLWAAGWRILFDLTLKDKSGKGDTTGTVAKMGESNALLFLFLHWGLFALIIHGVGWLKLVAFLYPLSAFILMIQPKNYVRVVSRGIYIAQGGMFIFLTLIFFWGLLL